MMKNIRGVRNARAKTLIACPRRISKGYPLQGFGECLVPPHTIPKRPSDHLRDGSLLCLIL